MKVFFSKTRQIRNRRTREKGFLQLETCKNEVDCNIVWHPRKKEQKRRGKSKEKERNLGSKVMCWLMEMILIGTTGTLQTP
jgi:hypothetical protein